MTYQRPLGGGGLKTLETDANAVKAAVLLYDATRNPHYLAFALERYDRAERERARHGATTRLVGNLGEICCEQGHARVEVDGHPTFDETGI